LNTLHTIDGLEIFQLCPEVMSSNMSKINL
jgi:hypothetical protein